MDIVCWKLPILEFQSIASVEEDSGRNAVINLNLWFGLDLSSFKLNIPEYWLSLGCLEEGMPQLT